VRPIDIAAMDRLGALRKEAGSYSVDYDHDDYYVEVTVPNAATRYASGAGNGGTLNAAVTRALASLKRTLLKRERGQ